MMMFCKQCAKKGWPYLFAVFISGVVAFLTWLMLNFSRFPEMERILLSLVVFAAAAATLLHYVSNCLKRHCRPHRPVRG